MNTIEQLDRRVQAVEKLLGIAETKPVSNGVKNSRKRPLHKKICHICGQECKGNIGLNVHLAKCRKIILKVNSTSDV